MASTSAISLPLLPCTGTSPHRKSNYRALSTTVSASLRNENYGRSVVDENLIVLRKRIHEMKQAESRYEPPAHWMEWEKKCYAGKDEFVCELMGLLQTWMMDARPCLVLGAILVVALSLPAAGAVAWFQMLAVIKGVFTWFPYLIN
ncbi:hypothetical protein RHSIM_Rhsim09G0100300 [Rhododendron simsii]|uniref:Uncharacterized protein n=1 Tax=Rhododendron simsii TaxID=118357 RepID=A0A834GF26_RHOSS|nr:hypothetical protein RHSIM_Rhsim09G0100300 [Rhododendron simsii]